MAGTPNGRAIAVTIDDLPAVSMTSGDVGTREVTTSMLLAALAADRVPAVGFVIEYDLGPRGVPDPRQVALLRRWLDAGHELGNHTQTHPDLHRVPAATYCEDVLRGERVLRPLLAERAAVPRWFRHPYLHTGRSLEARDQVRRLLAGRGYRVAPVTVVPEDFWFAAAHDWAVHRADPEGAERVAREYRLHLERTIEHAEAMSRGLFGREIPQVLLLHSNRLNGRELPAILAMLRERGYGFVTLEQALRDPAYDSPDHHVGPEGSGWLVRWALARGLDPETVARSPEFPAWVQRMARTPVGIHLRRWVAHPREFAYAVVKKPLRETWRAIRRRALHG